MQQQCCDPDAILHLLCISAKTENRTYLDLLWIACLGYLTKELIPLILPLSFLLKLTYKTSVFYSNFTVFTGELKLKFYLT